jgi:hypothetical protein
MSALPVMFFLQRVGNWDILWRGKGLTCGRSVFCGPGSVLFRFAMGDPEWCHVRNSPETQNSPKHFFL